MNTNENFFKKVVVITGGANGIGFELAREFAKEKAIIILLDKEFNNFTERKNEIIALGAELETIILDVTKPDKVTFAAQQIKSKHKRVDLLVNSAGVSGVIGSLWEMPLESMQWVINVNVMGMLYCIRAFVPLMKDCGGSRILNIGSIYSFYNEENISAYQISKQAVLSLSESLIIDLENNKYPIKVSILCPGWVKTDLLNIDKRLPEELKEILKNRSHTKQEKKTIKKILLRMKNGENANAIAKLTIKGVKENKTYILPPCQEHKNIKNRLSFLQKQF